MARANEMFELMERALEGGIPDGPALEDVAIQYAEFSRETRARVTAALELARRGLRMELVAVMQELPSLIETADRFTGDTAKRWREYCKQRGLALPAKVSLSSLEELQLALAASEDSGLAQLHRLYRRQSLGLASVYDRLQTLRRIARLDRGNSLWTEDLPAFEAEALRELRKRIGDAIKAKQLEEAAEILSALQRDDWNAPEATKLASRSEAELVQAIAEQARERSSECAREMYAAYMAESVDRVKESLALWEGFVAQMAAGGLSASRGSTMTVAPIIEWLAQRENQAEVVRETQARLEGLERVAVDTKASADEIQARLVAAEQMPGGVPDELREMAHRRVREHTASVRVRRSVRFIGVGVAVAAVLAAAVWLVLGLLRAERERVFAETLAAAVGRDDGEEVRRLVAQAKEEASGLDQLPAVLASLEQLSKQEADAVERDHQFEEQFAAAGDPNAATDDNAAIKAASELARTDEQRQRIAQWRDARLAAAVRSQQARDGAFLEQVKGLAREIDTVAVLATRDPGTEEAVKRVEIMAAQLGGAQGIGRDARVAFDTQRRRLLAVREGINQEAAQGLAARAHATALDEVVAASFDPAKLSAALEAFADANPESPYAADFRDAAAHSSQWQPLLAWMPVGSRIARTGIPAAAIDRAELRAQLEKFETAHPGSVVSRPLAVLINMLSDGRGWADWIGNIIKTWPPMAMGMVELNSGVRYYTMAGEVPKPTATDGTDVITVVLSWADEKVGPVRLDRKQVKRIGPSPQQELADKLMPLIKGPNAKPSGEGALEAIALIRDRAAMDPVARAYLLNGLLQQAIPALPSLEPKLTRAIQLLQEEDLEGIDWLSPGVPSARKDYKLVSDLLTGSVAIGDWQREYRAQTQAVKAWLDGSLRPVGVLDRTVSPFVVRSRRGDEPRAGETLYAVTDRDGKITVAEIGSVSATAEVAVSGEASTMPSGTPVFAGRYSDPSRSAGGSR